MLDYVFSIFIYFYIIVDLPLFGGPNIIKVYFVLNSDDPGIKD